MILKRTCIYIFTICALCIFCGCVSTRHIKNCLPKDSNVRRKIFSQIDSAYLSYNNLLCRKYKKIINCELSSISNSDNRIKLEIKVENKCRTWEHFHFDDKFRLIEVIHELETVY